MENSFEMDSIYQSDFAENEATEDADEIKGKIILTGATFVIVAIVLVL